MVKQILWILISGFIAVMPMVMQKRYVCGYGILDLEPKRGQTVVSGIKASSIRSLP